MKKDLTILILLIVLLILINYNFLNSILEQHFGEEKEFGIVERVIDGDTVIINGTSVRLLGINSPERGEDYYKKAKEFLEERILNKTVELRYGKEKYDKYNRKLAYLFLDGNVNLMLVENGFANFYFPAGKDKYYDEFTLGWEKCLENGKNLCEKSKEECIILRELDYINEIVILENICSSNINLKAWMIKDQGRKKYVFGNFILEAGEEVQVIVGEGEDSKDKVYWNRNDYVWTDSGDSLFLRDLDGKLVLVKHY
jgi:micrococcal nuclease